VKVKLAEIEDQDKLTQEALRKRQKMANPDYFLLLIVASLFFVRVAIKWVTVQSGSGSPERGKVKLA